MDESTTPRRLSRRTVAKGAAWTVPAVAVVSPTPAMAASPGIITLTGQNCKLPGASTPGVQGAIYSATISNTTNAPINIAITSIIRGAETQFPATITVTKLSTSPAGDCCTLLGSSFMVPANSSGTYAIITSYWQNSANNLLTLNYTVDAVPQPPATGADTGLNPIGGGDCGGGGSCSLTDAQKACISRALGTCPTGACS